MKNLSRHISAAILFVTLLASSLKAQESEDYIYYPPTKGSKDVALMLFGGSEGGLPSYYDTESLTQQGYPCIIVGYFGTKNTPDSLELIPLEYFEEVMLFFTSKPEVKDKKLVLWGGSKGGELALLLASRYPQVRGVIATVPSAVVFQGIGGRVMSSWSYNGESIPFVPYAEYDWSKIVNSQYVEAYEKSLEQSKFVEEAAIEVENINGPILLLTGRSDTMWPSSQMGDMIVRRLKEKDFTYPIDHYAYENAGHTLNDAYMMGGTKEGNRKANIDLALRINEFLESMDSHKEQ
ncbi:BAAT / Acyl-CoA thioester hydrolase C terminal domain family protein [Verrucomicrobiia bacterium DG1235]|nr:BAAT / Acyl-CoA thioester hydrolase C terminal domain family protein [Verrucomicrobiae bacterium DG1235]